MKKQFLFLLLLGLLCSVGNAWADDVFYETTLTSSGLATGATVSSTSNISATASCYQTTSSTGYLIITFSPTISLEIGDKIEIVWSPNSTSNRTPKYQINSESAVNLTQSNCGTDNVTDIVTRESVCTLTTLKLQGAGGKGIQFKSIKVYRESSGPVGPSYSITYSAGTGASGSIEAGVKSHDVDFTLSSETFTRSGFAQIGWAASDGGAKVYDLGGTYTENADIELFPAWIEGSSYTFDYSDAKTISQLKALGWAFNSDVFDADPADNEAYVNLVSVMNSTGGTDNKLQTPKNSGMEDNAIAFTKTASASAIYDLGDEYNVYSVSATLYGGSGSGFEQHIKYLGSDGSTVILDKTNNLNAGNWKANSLSYSDAVSGVRYIAIYGASKWVVMTNFTVVYGNMYQEVSLPADTWTTFSPSFDVDIPSGVTAYKLAYAGGESATASSISETKIKAAEGVLLKASEAGVYQFVKTTGATELDDNILKGTTERTLVSSLKTKDNFYAFDKTDSKFKLYTGEYFPANKAYFETGATLAPSAIRIELEENGATDIKSVEEKETAVKFFDGGRILIMKNGLVYDALGRVIR